MSIMDRVLAAQNKSHQHLQTLTQAQQQVDANVVATVQSVQNMLGGQTAQHLPTGPGDDTPTAPMSFMDRVLAAQNKSHQHLQTLTQAQQQVDANVVATVQSVQNMLSGQTPQALPTAPGDDSPTMQSLTDWLLAAQGQSHQHLQTLVQAQQQVDANVVATAQSVQNMLGSQTPQHLPTGPGDDTPTPQSLIDRLLAARNKSRQQLENLTQAQQQVDANVVATMQSVQNMLSGQTPQHLPTGPGDDTPTPQSLADRAIAAFKEAVEANRRPGNSI